MVDNAAIATKSALQAAFSPANSLPLLASAHGHFPGAQSHSSGGGMKLEAVMENLQKQQAARLALEEKLRQAEKEKEIRSMVKARIQQQAPSFRHFQAAVQGSFTAGYPEAYPGASSAHHCQRTGNRQQAGDSDVDDEADRSRDIEDDDRDIEEDELEDDRVGEEEESYCQADHSHQSEGGREQNKSAGHSQPRIGQASYPAPRESESPGGEAPHGHLQQHDWTYEEQFKQLYELDDDEKRKEFLDDLFSFMQKRGTPVNRIPIMAKQVLDLYTLYKLVTEKGGLVEVINKKIWREITKGLNLPTSITSAAFTLRTQYMKYLYPYECEKRGLSSPGELQAAIDSNRREGRRQSYSSAVFSYSPVGTPSVLSSPKIQMSHMAMGSPNVSHLAHAISIKKEDPGLSSSMSTRHSIPSLVGQHTVAAQAAAAQAAAAAQVSAFEQLREKLEAGEPPEKKIMLMAEEQQRIMQQALQQNLLAMATQLPMNIKINSRDDRQEAALNLSTNCISSINMSIEINGVVYTGVLFARKSAFPVMPGSNGSSLKNSQGKCSPGLHVHIQPSVSSSSSFSSSSSSSALGHTTGSVSP
ncbi:AT-rich interactive domain-containing protein 3A isoform X2 [Brienomyrus brachyistius]|uniref:AT-rich interactive domain-containing protein 3A isoform X2 n=1 Tax=Brienomyrus brachyistius TaxID=42636 RepID=UPI0020B38107|nr:AT-rich interactive domain-containing protein 3A isoform X2 [Brienomyrus brachyistius]